MARTQRKPAAPETPRTLAPADHVAVLLADRDMAVARAQLAVAQEHRETVQAQYQLALVVADQKQAAAAAAAAQAEAAHQRVVADIGQRYAVDWQQASFVPETGELVGLPEWSG